MWSCRWDEDTFGLEYDLDVFHIVAVSSFNMVCHVSAPSPMILPAHRQLCFLSANQLLPLE